MGKCRTVEECRRQGMYKGAAVVIAAALIMVGVGMYAGILSYTPPQLGTGETAVGAPGTVAVYGTLMSAPGSTLAGVITHNIAVYDSEDNLKGVTTTLTGAFGTSNVPLFGLAPGGYRFKVWSVQAGSLWNPVVFPVTINKPTITSPTTTTGIPEQYVVIGSGQGTDPGLYGKPLAYVLRTSVGGQTLTRICAVNVDAEMAIGTTVAVNWAALPVVAGLSTVTGLVANTPFTITFSVQVNTAYSQLGTVYTDPSGPTTISSWLVIAVNNTAQNAVCTNSPTGSVINTHTNGTIPLFIVPIDPCKSTSVAGQMFTSVTLNIPATSGNAYLNVWYVSNSTGIALSGVGVQNNIPTVPPNGIGLGYFSWNGAATLGLSLRMASNIYLGI